MWYCSFSMIFLNYVFFSPESGYSLISLISFIDPLKELWVSLIFLCFFSSLISALNFIICFLLCTFSSVFWFLEVGWVLWFQPFFVLNSGVRCCSYAGAHILMCYIFIAIYWKCLVIDFFFDFIFNSWRFFFNLLVSNYFGDFPGDFCVIGL